MLLRSFTLMLALVAPLILATPVQAADAHSIELHGPAGGWSHDGIFGTYDRGALQRGFAVYKQVCASCHSMSLLRYRNLTALGYSEAEVKAIAAEYTVEDGPNDEGNMFERPARPSDAFKAPFANEKAARAANGGAYPPDLSLIIKARPNGANYVYSLMMGYADAPADVQLMPGMSYNKVFPGHQIAMPNPISGDDLVSYSDGTKATHEQMVKDVTQFLAWASEPHLEDRKRIGVRVILFLIVMSGILYAAKIQLWRKVH